MTIRTWNAGALAFAALAACAQDGGDRSTAPQETADQTVVGDLVLPQAATTSYATFAQPAGQPMARTSSDVEVTFARNDRATVVTAAGGGGNLSARVTLPDSKPTVRDQLPPGVVDLFELMPPAGTVIKLGEPFESQGPDDEFIFEEADHDRMVMWQPMSNEPVAIVRQPGFTLVRLEATGFNRLYFVDDDGTLAHSDMGAAYAGVTDLVKVDGQGWQVLRFVRFSEVEGMADAPRMGLADARTRRHATFLVCAKRMDVLGTDLAQAHGLLLDDVPEFASCGAP